MSRNLLQWLSRTRMEEGMIWNTYFRHRRQELRETFPQCRGKGTSTNFMTYLQIRTILGDGLHYYILSENKDYVPIDPYDFYSPYFVEKICFEFLDDGLTNYVINCYCRKKLCPNPTVEIPRLHFWINIKYWSPMEARDFIETLPQFFDQWREELRTLNREIPKIGKKWNMRRIRAEFLGKRKIQSYILSRYDYWVDCWMLDERVWLSIPLSDGHDIEVETEFVYYFPDWVERTMEVVDAFVEYFECKIRDEGADWMPVSTDIEWVDGKKWNIYAGDWEIPEDLKALVASKKRWRKLMPIEVKIY